MLNLLHPAQSLAIARDFAGTLWRATAQSCPGGLDFAGALWRATAQLYHVIGRFALLLTFLLMAQTSGNTAQNIRDRGTVDDFALYDQSGNSHQLTYDSDQKAIVLFSYAIGCPIARKSISNLQKLREQYGPSNVRFFFIDANDSEDRQSLQKEAEDYHIDFSILEDPRGIISRTLGIQRTAEALLIDPGTWKVLYQGPVDDSLHYEINRENSGHSYLKDALDSFLNHKHFNIIPAKTKGCLISFPRRKTLSYTKDVAPVFRQKCLTCHSPGGAAPWSMTDFEKITHWGPMIREVVMTRRMPPWHADPHYGSFRNDISLSSEDADKIISWVDEGMIRGKGKDPLAVSVHSPARIWDLGPPDAVFALNQRQSLPATGQDIFNVVEADHLTDRDMWIRAFQIKPGHIKSVHHCNVVISNDQWQDRDKSQSLPLAMAGMQEEKWFKDSGVTMKSGQQIGGYSPGMGAFELPEDTGIFIPKKSRILFNMHYITTGKPELDLTSVGFYELKQKPDKIFSVAVIHNRGIHVPAGDKNYRMKGEHVFKDDVLVTALQPHMHFRGKAMRFSAIYPDGKSEILLSVPNYRFTWQRQYVFSEPKRIPAGTKIILEGTYDNSGGNPANPDPGQAVDYGPGSKNEMFTGIIYYIKVK